MATTAMIAIARAGFIHAVEVGGGFSVGILSKVAMGQYSHCPARMRLTRPSGCETPDIVGPDRSPERAFASADAHTGVSPVWPDAHRVRKSAIMNTPAFSDSTHESVNLPDKPARSEERRVGKECRSRRAPQQRTRKSRVQHQNRTSTRPAKRKHFQ